MIELPEAYALAGQLTQHLAGRSVIHVEAGHSPHRFCWFSEAGAEAYGPMLRGKTIGSARYFGGHVEIELENLRLDVHDGAHLQLFLAGSKLPPKHQLLIGLDDGSMLVGRVQMYGSFMLFPAGEHDNYYYQVAQQKPCPLSPAFDAAYFQTLLDENDLNKLSAKAFLATEQRIPGLGNGVLQDILLRAGVHPKSKMAALTAGERDALYHAVKSTLQDMAEQGGRDTEKGLLGQPGGYATLLSKNNKAMTCPLCGGAVQKAAYLGGSVYVCAACQPLKK